MLLLDVFNLDVRRVHSFFDTGFFIYFFKSKFNIEKILPVNLEFRQIIYFFKIQKTQ